MLDNTREADLLLFARLAEMERPQTRTDVPLRVVMPAFLISELKTAFQIGFLLFLPFLVIDLVVSSVLLSMGMMMLRTRSSSGPGWGSDSFAGQVPHSHETHASPRPSRLQDGYRRLERGLLSLSQLREKGLRLRILPG